ncbi:MAG: hypothetical protein ABJN35_02620 [Erythrobacter sp.]
MKVELKTWAGLGLATALAGAGLAGCSGEAGEGGEAGESAQAAQSGELGEAGEAGEAGDAGEGGERGGPGALPIDQRLVFMAGHVEAGLALYRAGESAMAAPHLMHPVSETHADERAGLDALGFNSAPFESVSAALEAGQSADEIEPLLNAAEANLAAMREASQADSSAQIRFLMETAVAEYTISVTEGVVTDAAEYQDAWGFVKVARDIAETLDAPKADAVRETLDTMLDLWPDNAPIAPDTPTDPGQVSALASRVMLDLP